MKIMSQYASFVYVCIVFHQNKVSIMIIKCFLFLLNFMYCEKYCRIQKKEKGGWDYGHGLDKLKSEEEDFEGDMRRSCTVVDCSKGNHLFGYQWID